MSEEIALAIGDIAELIRQIGEQNTTIGYQDAMLAELRAALDVAMIENDQHQAANAALVRELVYARAVVAAARRVWIAHPSVPLADVLAAYDQATKGNKE